MRRQRIKGLNRRVFKGELKKVLKSEFVKMLSSTFEVWVEDYARSVSETGRTGWYEISASEHKYSFVEEIRTN